MRSRLVAVLAASAALLGGSLSATTAATAATSTPKVPLAKVAKVTKGATKEAVKLTKVAQDKKNTSVTLPGVVSPSPATFTPNVSAGSCSSSICDPSDIYATAVVNGEIVVAGAFESVCSPVSSGYAPCSGGGVTRTYIFAYNPENGAIDPTFDPVLDTGPVNALAAGPGNTVYIGGAFNTVNGTSAANIAQLQVTPGNSTTDGQLVSGFNAKTGGTVTALAYDGNNALYVSGDFTTVDGKTTKVARVNATTGAYDSTFSFSVTDPVEDSTLHVERLALAPNGDTLALAGTFLEVNGQSDPRVALINTGGGLGDAATLIDWSAPDLANNCAKQHDYVNGIDFSPDSSFFVIADTGFDTTGGPAICDGAARFNTNVTGNSVQPVWIDYTGGDTLHSVVVTGGVVYIGGHERWVNNECGSNWVCEDNAVLVNGLAALDANTGLGLPYWHPMTSRGVGVMSLMAYPSGTSGTNGGLVVGINTDSIGGATHDELGEFPMTNTSQPPVGGPIPSGIWADGRPGQNEDTNKGNPVLCVDDTGNSSSSGTQVEAITCQNDNEQNWTEQTPGGSGEIQINGLCLDSSGGNAVVDTCTGGSSQLWSQGSSNTLQNGAEQCLIDPSASQTSGTKLTVGTCSAGSTSQSWPLPAAQAPPAPPAIGVVYPYQEQSSSTKKGNTISSDVPCMTDKNGATAAGSPIVVYDCFGYATQYWIMQSNGTIQLNNSHGKYCLDTSGSNVVINTCDGASSQVWTPSTSRELKNSASGLCLNDPSSDGANNTQLDVTSCSATGSEEWYLPTY